jgi:RNA polymerase sigma-70 factor (ECF subfamily)
MSATSEAVQRAAAEFLRDRHRLGAFVYGLLRDSHAAEDVLQEVWLRLAAEVEKGTELQNQNAWCRGVARNLIRKIWDRSRTAKVVPDSSVLDALLDKVEQSFAETDDLDEDWAERQEALNDCVSSLPEPSRRLLALRYESQASIAEVAQTLDRSFEGVTKALYRLRKDLLDCVQRKLAHR